MLKAIAATKDPQFASLLCSALWEDGGIRLAAHTEEVLKLFLSADLSTEVRLSVIEGFLGWSLDSSNRGGGHPLTIARLSAERGRLPPRTGRPDPAVSGDLERATAGTSSTGFRRPRLVLPARYGHRGGQHADAAHRPDRLRGGEGRPAGEELVEDDAGSSRIGLVVVTRSLARSGQRQKADGKYK